MSNIESYVEIPEYYFKLDIFKKISSELLNDFLKSDLSPLDYMRKYYLEDIEKFYAVRDELLIRGICFKKEYQNNFFPGLSYQIKNLIVKENKTVNFKKINFSLIGLSNFIHRFQVVSDTFFNYMPLEGIGYLAKDFSLDFIKQLFEEAGYKILPLEETIKIVTKGHGKTIELSKLYKGEVFEPFLRYSNKLGIKDFSELSIDILVDFEKKGIVEENIINEIKDIYQTNFKKYCEMESSIEEAVAKLYNNSFQKLLDCYGYNYLDVLNKFYNADHFEYSNENYPFESIKNIEKEIIEKMEEEREQALIKVIEEKKATVIEHKNFKFLMNFSLSELRKEFSLKIEERLQLNLTLLELVDTSEFLDYYYIIIDVLEKLKSPEEIIEGAFNNLKENQLDVLMKRQQGLTLEEIGKNLNLTRERIRQIEKKAISKILNSTQLHISFYFKYYAEHAIAITIDEFAQDLDIKDKKFIAILKVLVDNDSNIVFLDQIKRYIHISLVEVYESKVDKIDFSKPLIPFEEIEYAFEDFSSRSVQKIIDLLFNERGYLKGKNLYIKGTANLLSRINYLFKYVIDGPLEMNEEGFQYISTLMNEYFPIPFESNKRAITTRISEAQETILIDSSTYMYFNPELVSEEFIEMTNKLITEELKNAPYADPRKIFSNNKALMEQNRIISPVHFYSLVQIYLDDNFDTGRGNTLYIFKNNAEKIGAEEILIKYLNKKNGMVVEEKALEDLEWKPYKLEQLLGRITSIIRVGNKQLKLVNEYKFTTEELKIVKDFMDEQLKKGYVFTIDLLFATFSNSVIENILNSRELLDEYSLMGFLKWLYPELRGFSKLLYFKDSPIQTLEQILEIEFPGIITRSELLDFVDSKGYSEQMYYKIIGDLTLNKKFFYYSSTSFINSNQIGFTEQVKESLRDYLDKEFKDKTYVSVIALMGFTQKLPKISTSYEWSHSLIYELAATVGYKQIDTTRDYRYNKLVLVKDDSPINNYEDLIYFVAKHEYTGKFHEESFAQYLVSKKLAHNPRRLSSEIYESNYFSFDKLGFFSLVGGEN